MSNRILGVMAAASCVVALMSYSPPVPAEAASTPCSEDARMIGQYTQALSTEISAGDFSFREDVGRFFSTDYFEVVDRVAGIGTANIDAYLSEIAAQIAAIPGAKLAPIVRTDIACRSAAGMVVRSAYYDLTITTGSSSSTTRLLVTTVTALDRGAERKFIQSHRETLPAVA